MSCDGNRAKFFAHVCAAGGAAAGAFGSPEAAQQALDQIFDQARALSPTTDTPTQQLAALQTRALFAEMERGGLKPPTHSASGLPKKDAQAGYAEIYRTLQALNSGKALPALAAQITATNVQQRRLSAIRADEGQGRMRCRTCGRFAPANGGHTCPRTTSAPAFRRSLVRRLGVPHTAYSDGALANLIAEAKMGDVTMTHSITGERVGVTLDALPLALASGFTPVTWQQQGGCALVEVSGGRIVPVLDASGLVEITPPSSPLAAAAIASGTALPTGTALVGATTLFTVGGPAHGAPTTSVSGGSAYDTGRFVGTEFRKGRGALVRAGGNTYTVGDRSTDPRDWSSARHAGSAPEPPKSGAYAGIGVGRTLVGAVELLSTGRVIETATGLIEVCDASGALVAVYDPSSGTAGDIDGTPNASSAQMAAVLAYAGLHPSSPLDHALATDILAVTNGVGSPLAAADSAYLTLKDALDRGLPLNLGGGVGAQKCPTCGKFQSSAGCLSCAGAAPVVAAAVSTPVPAPASVASPISPVGLPPITVNVEAPQVTVESPTVQVAAPEVTVEAPQVSVEAPQVTVEPPSVTANVSLDVEAFAAALRAFAPPAPVAPGVLTEGAAAPAVAPTPAPTLAPADPTLAAVLTKLAEGQQASEARMLAVMERLAGTMSAMPVLPATSATVPAAPAIPVTREPLPTPGRAVTPDDQRTEQERMLSRIRLPAPDPNLNGVPDWAKGRQFQGVSIPVARIDPEFEINTQARGILRSVSALIEAGQRAGKPQQAFYFYGPPGTGKNYMAQQIAASVVTVDADGTERQGLPYFEREVTKDDTAADLLGTTQIEEGQTVVRLGPIGQALAAGGVVCLNEVVRNPKMLTSFQSILQERVIRIPSARGGVEEIPVHPASIIVMTANPGMEGDAQRPSGAPLSRMAPFKLDKATPEEQGNRCKAYFTLFPEDVRPNETEVKYAVDFVGRVNDACGKEIGGSLGKSTVAPGPRELNRFVLLGKTVGWTEALETMRVYCQQDAEDFETEWQFIKSQFEIVYGEDGEAVTRTAKGASPARS